MEVRGHLTGDRELSLLPSRGSQVFRLGSKPLHLLSHSAKLEDFLKRSVKLSGTQRLCSSESSFLKPLLVV